MTGAGSFVVLGASAYALRIVHEILARSPSRLMCVLDAGIDDARRHAIAEALGHAVRPADIHDTAVLRDPAFLGALRDRRPDVALSAHFSEILTAEFWTIPRHGVVNLHSSYLPYNRGHWPEVWSIVRGTPAGITLHYIADGIDTGPIIDQIRVPVLPEDTCESLARRIEVEGIALVVRNWDALIAGRATAAPQTERFPLNLHRHVEPLSRIDLDRSYTARELLDLLRALALPGLLDGAYFIDRETGDRIRVQVSLTREPTGGNRP